MPPPSGEPLEEIRAALRDRGYLDSGLDRLLLRGAGSRGGWLIGAAKAGVLSGLFLALALLAVLLLTSQPPVTSPREILLLAVYLFLLGSLLVATFEAAMALGARLLARFFPGSRKDTSRIAWWAGGIAALAGGLYLSLWWRGRGAEGWNGAVHLAVLPAILALSLAFGRITSLAALVSLIRPGRLPAPRGRHPREAMAVVLLVLLVGSIFAIPWGRSRDQRMGRAPGRFQVEPRRGRVLWIGIDGLGNDLLRTLTGGGHLSTLARIRREGCRLTFDRDAAEPPAVWVSVATGFSPSRHGVRNVRVSRLPYLKMSMGDSAWLAPLARAARWMAPGLRPVREVPVSGAQRRDKTIWEILSDARVPSTIVNWWATWPAEKGPGVRISERAFFKLQSGGPPDREIFPPSEFARLRQEFPRFQDSVRPQRSAGRPLPPDLPFLLDAYHLERCQEGWEGTGSSLVAVYLNGPDILSGKEEKTAPPAQRVRETERLVDQLEFLDAGLGRLLARTREGDLLVVVGDPGRGGDPAGGEGFLLFWGKGIREGIETRGTLLDVAPSLLRLLGFPLSLEMKGRPAEDCFDADGDLARDAPPPVATYGEASPPSREASEFDPEVLEKLRSLGYIR